MNKSPGYLSLLLLFSFATSAQTDDIRFHRIGTVDGLSRYRIFSIYQDTFGFIWFENSYKYNGREIKYYPHGVYQATFVGDLLSESWGKEPDSLIYFDPVRDQFINNVPHQYLDIPLDLGSGGIKDRFKNLWIGSGTANVGLYVYQRSTRSFKNIRHREGDTASLSSDRVTVIRKDRHGQIWVGTDSGLNLWEKDSTFRQFRHDPDNEHSLSADNIGSIAEDEQGYLWIGTINGLNRLDPLTKEITRISFPASLYPDVAGIFIDSLGRLWMLTKSGVITFEPDSGAFHQYFVDENGQPIFPAFYFGQINSLAITEDERKRIWMGTFASGIFIFDPATKRVANYRHDPSDPESLSDDNVRTFMKDRDGRIWIGTFDGVSMYDPNDKGFVHMESDKEGKLFFNTIPKYKGLEDRNGYIWISAYGSGGGLIRFAPQKEEFKLFKNFTGFIHNFVEDKNGNFWVPSTARDLHVFDPMSGQFILGVKKSGGLIYKDSNDHIWVGNSEGLFCYSDAKTEPVKIEWDSLKGLPGDYNHAAHFMVEGCSGELWIGTENQGLLKYDREKQSVRQYLPEPENTHSIASNSINGIFKDRNCNLWISVGGRGLSMLAHDQQNEVDPEFQLWNTENSNLPDNRVNSIIEDHQGRIWVASGTAISQFDRASNTFKVYGPESGMKTVPNNYIFPSRDGRIYITGKSGIGFFHPDSLIVNRQIPPVYLQDIRVNGHKLPIKGSRGDTLSFPSPLERSIALAPSIRLEHWQNEISLEFVALNYTTPIRNKFQYHLDGYDQEWKETDARQPFATYTNLDPGTYTFRVKGSNNDDLWNDEGAALNIVILPPWWKTVWAYILWTGLAIAGLLFLYRFQLRRRLAEAEAARLKELDRVKTRLYTNITHEFRTPLTIIAGIVDQIRENPKKWLDDGLDMIKRNNHKLLTLVNQMLDLRKLESGVMSLHLQQGDIIPYLKYIMENFQAYAAGKNIRLHFLSERDEFFMDHDPDKLLQVVSNLLSNALKFTQDGGDVYFKVDVQSGSGSMFLISIRDTGIGIAQDKLPYIFDRFYQVDDRPVRSVEGTGIGLALTRELIHLMKGKITVESRIGEGTEFRVLLPVSHQAPLTRNFSEVSLSDQTARFITEPSGSSYEKTVAQGPKEEVPLILIVEDNRDIVGYLSALLKKDYRLEVAGNGREGIEKAIEQIPDIVISDVMMPEVDGYTLCHTLKEDERSSHIPIILLTARADQDSRVAGLQKGADAYLSKPFQKEELLIRIRKLIELRRRLQIKYQNDTFEIDAATEKEDLFVLKVKQLIIDHLDEANYGVAHLCQDLQISRVHLYRKIRALTGKTLAHYIRQIRLQEARRLLLNTDLNVSEIAYEVGFKDPNYFSRVFTDYFGKSPSSLRAAS